MDTRRTSSCESSRASASDCRVSAVFSNRLDAYRSALSFRASCRRKQTASNGSEVTVFSVPTDLTGQIFKPVDFDDLDGVAREVHLWAAEDLDLGRCAACPPK